MESKDELKEINIKNRTCCNFDDVMKARDIDSGNILWEEKIYKNNLIYDNSHKIFMGSKPLRIWFDKIEGFIKIYDGIRYLVILDHSWFDEICDINKYLMSEKNSITDSINCNVARIRIDFIILYLYKKYWLFIMF